MELVNLDRYEKEIVAGKRRGLLGAIQIGMALGKIREGNLWANTGAKSFEKYVSAAHGFSRSTSYNLMAVAVKFGRHILADSSLQSIEPTRLIRLLPFVQELDGQSNAEDLLHQAAQIPGAQAFEDQVRNLAGKTATDDPHTHDFQPINIMVCSVCGLRKKGLNNAP